MKSEEFAFINQRLAGMLKAGIPLEGALNRLRADLGQGKLRQELEKLESDLAQGTPLREAIGKRELPELYQHLVQVGAKSGDLPGVLTLAADYYQRLHLLTVRLRTLLIYPGIVLLAGTVVPFLLVVLLGKYLGLISGVSFEEYHLRPHNPNDLFPPILLYSMVLAPALLVVGLALGYLALLLVPCWRRWALERLPGFREAQISRLASSLGALLKGGCRLGDAVALLQRLESGTLLGRELARWQQCKKREK